MLLVFSQLPACLDKAMLHRNALYIINCCYYLVPTASEWTADYYCNREGLLFGSDACFGTTTGPSRFPDDADVHGFNDMLREYMNHMKLIG